MEPQNDLDTITKFLQSAGWSFGWVMIEENGEEQWQVDASKGKKRFVARHKSLNQALKMIRYMVLSLN
jgi:hypothetical protein